MANAQNIDRIFAELAKKVQREVQINLPRKVGIIAKNHFTDNFRKGGFVDSSLEPWQTTKRQQSGRGAEGKYTPLTSRRDHLMRSITSHPRPGEVTIINDVEYANIHNEGGVVNPKVTDKMRRFAWYKVYSLAGIRKGSKKKGKTAKPLPPEAEAWKAIALTKKSRLHIKIPQRKFIGDSRALNKKIEELIISTINKLTQDGVSTLHPH